MCVLYDCLPCVGNRLGLSLYVRLGALEMFIMFVYKKNIIIITLFNIQVKRQRLLVAAANA